MPEPSRLTRLRQAATAGLSLAADTVLRRKRTESTRETSPEKPAKKIETGFEILEDRAEFELETPLARISGATHEGGEANKNSDKAGVPRNEDTAATQVIDLPDGSKRVQLILVDGAGGSADGKLAGQITRDSLLRILKNENMSVDILRNVMSAVSSEVKANAGGGYACAVVVDVSPDRHVRIGWRGDTGAITFRGGQILPEGTTKGDNRAQLMIDAGLTRPERYYTHPEKSSITSAFGHGKGGSDPIEFVGQTGDILVSFSDGAVRDLVSDYEVQKIVVKHGSNVELIRKELVQLALDRNNSAEPYTIEHAPGVFVDMTPQSGSKSEYAIYKKAQLDTDLSNGKITRDEYDSAIAYSQKGGDNISVLVTRLNFEPVKTGGGTSDLSSEGYDPATDPDIAKLGRGSDRFIDIDPSIEAHQARVAQEQFDMSPDVKREFDKLPENIRETWALLLRGKDRSYVGYRTSTGEVFGTAKVVDGDVLFNFDTDGITHAYIVTNELPMITSVDGELPLYSPTALEQLPKEYRAGWKKLFGSRGKATGEYTPIGSDQSYKGTYVAFGEAVYFSYELPDNTWKVLRFQQAESSEFMRFDTDPNSVLGQLEAGVEKARELVSSLWNKVAGSREQRLERAGVSFEQLPDEFKIKLANLDDAVREKGERLIELRKALVEAERAVQDTWIYAGKERTTALDNARAEYEAARAEFVGDSVKHYIAEQLAIGEERTIERKKGVLGQIWDELGERNLDALMTARGKELTGWKKVMARNVSLRTGVSLGLLGASAFVAGGFGAIGAAAETSKMVGGMLLARRAMGATGAFYATDNLLAGKSIDILGSRTMQTVLEKKRKADADPALPGITEEDFKELMKSTSYLASASALEGRSVHTNPTYVEAIKVIAEIAGAAQLSELMQDMDFSLEQSRKAAKIMRADRRFVSSFMALAVGSGVLQEVVGKAFGFGVGLADTATSKLSSGVESVIGVDVKGLIASALETVRHNWLGSNAVEDMAAQPADTTQVATPDMAVPTVTDEAMPKGFVGPPTPEGYSEIAQRIAAMEGAERAMYVIGEGEGISHQMYDQLAARAGDFGFTGEVPKDLSNLKALEGTPWKEWADKIVLETLKETKMTVDGKLVSLWDASKNENVWVLVKDRIAAALEPAGAGKASLTLIDLESRSIIPNGGAIVDEQFNVSTTDKPLSAGGVKDYATDNTPTEAGTRVIKGGIEVVDARPAYSAELAARDIADSIPAGLTRQQIENMPIVDKPASLEAQPSTTPSQGTGSVDGVRPGSTGAGVDTVKSPTTTLNLDRPFGQVAGALNSSLGTEVGSKVATPQGLVFERGSAGQILATVEGSAIEKVALSTETYQAIREVIPADSGTKVSAAAFDAAIQALEK